MTSSPSSWPGAGRPLRLETDSSTTRPPNREPAWFTRPVTVLAAIEQSPGRLAIGSDGPVSATGSRAEWTQRTTAAFVRTATACRPASTSPRQAVMACLYWLCW
jgi:hypothetical protein